MKTKKKSFLKVVCAILVLITLVSLSLFAGVRVIRALMGSSHQESASETVARLMPKTARGTAANSHGTSGTPQKSIIKGSGGVCSECMGLGYFEDHCFRCAGDGTILCHMCYGREGKACTRCGGNGILYDLLTDSKSLCMSCDGTGTKDCGFCFHGYEICTNCDGEGKIKNTCSKCGGSGYV